MPTRLIHLSDLHFGRDRPELMRPLIDAVNGLSPDLVAISGDLTQRAFASQFRAARTFIDHIDAPVLCVPGNHDLPVHRPVTRFFRPFHNYKKHINEELSPALLTPDVALIGINTMKPWRWQTGWASRSVIRRAARLCRSGPAHRLNVIVAHHPFELPPDSTKRAMINAEWGLATLAEAGADIILSGHLHQWRVISPPDPQSPEILQIHCGTGLSTRMRGEPNDFAEIVIGSATSDSDLSVTRWIAGPENRFAARETTRFHRGADGWQTATPVDPLRVHR
ncbi:metallophosphoesterase family protein [Pseudooceanicola onchidii]|uniref:metallophosphoesterase family protein n=1 Tax=Pseudooceanicola onchidii TaxID=2562279 RepID=UPI0010AB2006|nr:metallophosphoesterase [Pseudooceanicola onchidii]